MLRFLLTICLFVFINISLSTAQRLTLETFASGFEIPVSIAHANDDRLFVVEKRGRIKSVQPDGQVDADLFLNIVDRVNSSANERGLLGLAFHPDFQNNGRFFVYYTGSGGTTTVSRFNIDPLTQLGDPNSEVVLLSVDQPFSNHNGGCILFGPDGYLYIATGDGGAAGDPGNRSQDPMSYLGKMLRIDIDNGDPYAIPIDNPFANDDFTLDEIWATGLRNPWKFSFDKLTGDMWIGDVGQDAFEEVDFQPADSKGGENYGWKCYEGDAPFQSSICGGPEGLTFPVFTYITNENINGCSITGGYVYRGQEIPSLYGLYIFADFCTGQFWTIDEWACQEFEGELDIRGGFQDYTAFGEDQDGELYVAAVSEGAILKIGSQCLLNASGVVDQGDCAGGTLGSISLTVGGVDDYTVTWNNGAVGDIITGLPEGCYCATITDGNDNCEIARCFEVTDQTTFFETTPQPIETSSCFGVPTTISIVNPFPEFEIQWFLDGEILVDVTGTDIELESEGTYGIQFFNQLCLSDIYDYYIFSYSEEIPIPEITEGQNILTATSGYSSYLWYKDGVLIETTAINEFLFTESGTYTVIVMDENGCLSAASEPLVVIISSIIDLDYVQLFKLSPNPFNEKIQVQIQLTLTKDIRLQLFDNTGKEIEKRTFENAAQINEVISTVQLPEGLYLMQISIGSDQFVERIIK